RVHQTSGLQLAQTCCAIHRLIAPVRRSWTRGVKLGNPRSLDGDPESKNLQDPCSPQPHIAVRRCLGAMSESGQRKKCCPRCPRNDRPKSTTYLALFDRGGGSWTRQPASSADPWKFAFARGFSQATWRRSPRKVSPFWPRSAWSRRFRRCLE